MGTNLKESAVQLRRQGKSYGAILKELNLSSKGLLTYWFKDLILTKKESARLAKNVLMASKRGLLAFNSRRKQKIVAENQIFRSTGIQDVGSLSKRELMLIGTALYWGEGTKVITERRSPAIIFSNADPKMIALFLRFIREILKVPEERIRAGIHLYDSINENQARNFWARTTKLPKERFYIVNQISKASKRLRNTLPYGTAVIKVNSRSYFYKVLGMIEGMGQCRAE